MPKLIIRGEEIVKRRMDLIGKALELIERTTGPQWEKYDLILMPDYRTNRTKLVVVAEAPELLIDPKYPPIPPKKPPPPHPTPTPTSNIATKLRDLHNIYRSRQGLKPLSLYEPLNQLSGGHNDWMVRNNTLSHDEPGNAFSQRVQRSGLPYRSAGENIAMGYDTPEAVMEGWWNSPGHKRNILTPEFTHLGVAWGNAPGGRLYWTTDFMQLQLAQQTGDQTPIAEPGEPPTLAREGLIDHLPGALVNPAM
jgi:uncharacterized protein YkwD